MPCPLERSLSLLSDWREILAGCVRSLNKHDVIISPCEILACRSDGNVTVDIRAPRVSPTVTERDNFIPSSSFGGSAC